MAAQKMKLGDNYSGQFLKTTTHLIVGIIDVFSDKYRFAVERGVHILYKEWLLDSSREGRWLSEGKYRVPPFASLNIATTGFSQSTASIFIFLNHCE